MLTKTILLLFLITIFAQARESEGLTTTVKSHLYPKYTKWLDYQSGGEDFVYVMCNYTIRKPIDTHCIVSLESTTSFRPLWTCNNVTLKYKRNNGKMYLPVRVLQFGRNKALLIWSTGNDYFISERLKMNFVIVHLMSCRTSEVFTLRMNLNARRALELPVWTYGNDTFDIVYHDEGCGAEGTCKVTVNADGKQVAGPIPWFTFSYDDDFHDFGSFPLTPQTRSKGYLLLDNNFTDTDAIILTEDGLKYKTFASYHHSTSILGLIHSTAHHTIGICNGMSWLWHCEQYTLSGRLKLKVNVNFSRDNLIQRTILYNLPNGGFLLLGVRFPYGGYIRACLTKVDGNGQVMGSLEITGSKCHSSQLVANKFFEDESKKQCLTLVCQDSTSYFHMDSLDFDTTCFTDEDFQK